jgi:16S rRNA (adenine1518-N6/adenine1519-N6)-dimethyltransferase
MNKPRQKKRLGQVFLNQPNTIRKIIEDLQLTGEETVLEIGGGDGRLSEQLAPQVNRLIINEIDDRFVDVLQKRLGHIPHVHIVPGNILGKSTLVSLKEIIGDESVIVYGSIPYYITTPIMKWVLQHHSFISRASLLMQKEVAERATATPDTKEYGFLTVFLQLQSFVYPGALVRRSCFKPVPKVDSRVLNLIPREEDIAMYDKKFWQFISGLFSQRRKQLRNLVKNYQRSKPDEELEQRLRQEGIELTDRPENYAPHQLKLLYEIVESQ